MPLLLAPAEGLGALWAFQVAFGPLISSSIQKYTLRQLFGLLELQNLSIIKKKSKMAVAVSKWQPVIDIGVISYNSEFQPCSSSNG